MPLVIHLKMMEGHGHCALSESEYDSIRGEHFKNKAQQALQWKNLLLLLHFLSI